MHCQIPVSGFRQLRTVPSATILPRCDSSTPAFMGLPLAIQRSCVPIVERRRGSVLRGLPTVETSPYHSLWGQGGRFRTGSSTTISPGQPPCSTPRLLFRCNVSRQKHGLLPRVSNSIALSVIFKLSIGSLISLAPGLTSTTAPPSLFSISTTTTVIAGLLLPRLVLVCHMPTKGDCPKAKAVVARRRIGAQETLIEVHSTLY